MGKSLQDLIDALKAADPDRVLPLGFKRPHSYRGYYEDLAFEPAAGVRVGDMLAAARGAVGETFGGWKGGEYVMSEYSTVWLAYRGRCGETVGPFLLALMLGAPPPFDDGTDSWA